MHYTEVSFDRLMLSKEIVFDSFFWGKKVPENDEDQTTRRLQLKLILKDHLIVVQMYKLTESAFSTVLNSFYAVQVIKILCLMMTLNAVETKQEFISYFICYR